MKKYTIIFILLLGLALRVYGINWDQGLHLHPDERQLILVANTVHFWDQLNPNFFNYGSLPIYLVKGVSQFLDFILGTHLANYDNMLYVGRVLSVLFDTGTTFFIYQISLLIFKKNAPALLAAFLYAISFFPIQNSHFFVVDVFLTFFITVILYFLLKYLEKPSFKAISFISLLCGAALATKISVLIFAPVIIIAIYGGLRKNPRKGVLGVALFGVSTLMSHFIFMPYAYFSFLKFTQDTLLQAQMNKDAYIFPYTLQYVSTIPYLYYLKNIFLWGLGPILSFLSIGGVIFITEQYLNTRRAGKKIKRFWFYILFASFYLLYFIVIGRSAVKFMRYMLPLYPFFIILAGYGLEEVKKHSKWMAVAFFGLALIWTLSFEYIYSIPHTRITASNWILQNIPSGTALAVEHWDDRLPIMNSQNYVIQELTLYDFPDDKDKMKRISTVLHDSSYIIIASNRLYTPLPKLRDCKKFIKCYPLTTQYYKDLFSGKLGFTKVAEFSAFPKLPFLPISFSDQSADESFTVYDHPTIMIFKKSTL